jgi:thiamine-phosphate pyrophosphorylase
MADLRCFSQTGLYCITAARFSLGRSNIAVVKEMLEADIRIIQYREKDYSMLLKYRECVAIRELTAKYGACFIVNDDVHLALAVQADGVHVGQDDLPVEKVRQLVGDKMIIGLSTHSPEQADQAAASGIVDYIGVGPLYGTAIKKEPMPAVGLGYLDYVVARHRIPFVAIGGIKQHNIADVVRHGASCICLVSEIVGAPDIKAMIRLLGEKMQQAKDGYS